MEEDEHQDLSEQFEDSKTEEEPKKPAIQISKKLTVPKKLPKLGTHQSEKAKPSQSMQLPTLTKGMSLKDTSCQDRLIRKRKRKSGNQLQQLLQEFKANPSWTKEVVLEVFLQKGSQLRMSLVPTSPARVI